MLFVVFAVRNPEDSKRAMLGMCYILDPDLSLPNKVISILNSDPNKVIIMLGLVLNSDFTLVAKCLIADLYSLCVTDTTPYKESN